MRSRSVGFTLVELLLTLVILAIVMAWALPSYQQALQHGRRSDALTVLTTAANAQQHYWARHNGYSNDAQALGLDDSNQGYYRLSIAVHSDGEVDLPADAAPLRIACSGEPCFIVAATAQGTQRSDDDCAVFTLDQLGRKRSYRSDASANPAGAQDPCW